MQTNKNTHWKKLTNPNYLGSWDIDLKTLTVTITHVEKQLVTAPGGEKEECLVAVLEGHKPMILNKTNCKAIERVVGSPYIEQWAGKSITITTEKVRAFGETVDALRVVSKKTDTREELTPNSPRWSGAVEALSNGSCDVALIEKNFIISSQDLQKLEEESNAV